MSFKTYASDKDSVGGVWRTIGGRRIFIKDGQGLANAMKESKKFSKKEVLKKDIAHQVIEAEKNGNWAHAEIGKRELKRLNKEDEDYKLYKQAKENPDSIDPMTENSTDWEALDKKYGARYKEERDDYETSKQYSKETKEELDKASVLRNLNTDVEYKKLANGQYRSSKDGYDYYIDTNVENKDNPQFESVKVGNDYLPKANKVETAGTSNRKEVSDNIQAHILSYYDNPVDFMEQMNNMDWLPTKWHAGQELAKGGSYLIYNSDIAEYLNSLNINPKGKSFSDDRVFEVYTNLIGRESERLYNRLEKLYKQYKSEHKNSNLTLDDFRKWFK